MDVCTRTISSVLLIQLQLLQLQLIAKMHLAIQLTRSARQPSRSFLN